MLNPFYKALQEWIDGGCQQHEIFEKGFAICSNYYNWAYSMDLEPGTSELKNQFEAAGLDRFYPFNDGDGDWFGDECDDKTLWQNPQRLEWVKNHANS